MRELTSDAMTTGMMDERHGPSRSLSSVSVETGKIQNPAQLLNEPSLDIDRASGYHIYDKRSKRGEKIDFFALFCHNDASSRQ
jgi:hypothetical protein